MDMQSETANQPANSPETLQFEFTGNAVEFFKIWIVNICLTIVTLGIYSAWAKVRTNKYFYGNTVLAGSSFEYLANPITILKGRLIAFALFVVYSVATAFFPLSATGIPWSNPISMISSLSGAFSGVLHHFRIFSSGGMSSGFSISPPSPVLAHIFSS